MPNTSSAKKALRVSARKNVVNARVKKSMRVAKRAVVDALGTDDVKTGKAKLPEAYKQIDLAAKKGVINKNKAARFKSRLAAAVKKADTK